jgi:Ca2+-binding RTX toxin-like protein
MADPITRTTHGLFNAGTNAEGVRIFTLDRAYWAQMPYFELVGATDLQAQVVEDLLRGYNLDTKTLVDPQTSLFAQFLAGQRAVVPVDYLYERDPLTEPKSHEDPARGTYFRLNFVMERSTTGAHTVDQDADLSQPAIGKPYDLHVKDVDNPDPDREITINGIQSERVTLRRGQRVQDLTMEQLPFKPLWELNTRNLNANGIRNWQSLQSLNTIHEVGHALFKEGALADGMSGHIAPYQSLLTGTGGFTVSQSDVRLDPVEKFAFEAGKQLGYITNDNSYWRSRTLAYQQKLDRLILDKGIKTRAELAAYIQEHAEEVANAPIVITEIGAAGYIASMLTESAFRFDISDLAGVFGSTLGRMIAGDNPLEQIALSSTLGSVLSNLGELLERPGGVSGGAAQGGGLGEALKEAFGEDLLNNLQSQAVGAVSSYLVGELTASLGLEGPVGEAANVVGARVVSQVATNLFTNQPWFTGINTALFVNAIGSWIGGRLAMEVGNFDTRGGQIGYSIGQAYGGINAAIMLAQNPWLLSNPILAIAAVVIVVFLDALLGGFIGSLFGGTPRSGAGVAWDEATGEFGVTAAWSKSGGSKETARSFATTVAEFLNGIVESTGSKVADAAGIRVGGYGMRKKDFVYYATGGAGAGETTFKTRDANALINHGAAIAIYDLASRLMGGNIYVKRAIAATLAAANGAPAQNYAGAAGTFDVNTLLGNISIANDYASYVANRLTIDSMMALDPQSGFAAGWLVTLTRAWELGLHKRAATDWIGGWTVLLDEALDGKIDGTAFSPANLQLQIDPDTHERVMAFVDEQGELLGIVGDSIENGSKDIVLGTAGNDSIVVAGGRIANTAGLTIDGTASAGGQHVIDVAALIDGGAGNDTLLAGDLGNDLLGGDGNDTLVGGKLDDWLFGGAGNDRLFAGAASYSFADGDAAATAAALGTSSNGDFLDGGEGDDVLYGSTGSDWLKGGSGVDLLHGGAGGDIIEGGAGNDQGGGGEARLFGGAGTDQYLFGYGDGVDVLFDESDNAASPGVAGDSLHTRLQDIEAGVVARNWAGGGNYEVDGSVKGGEDAVVFGVGIGFQDLILRRSGTQSAPGQDLIIQLTHENPDTHVRTFTGDQLTVKDWFESTRRVEWLRFANGEDIRIGDVSSFLVGSAGNDVIIGTYDADFLWGGDGNDTMRGLQGDDFGFGGHGNDMIGGDEDNDMVSGGYDEDSVLGDAGNDTVFGDAGDDVVYGGSGSDIVVGGRGDDQVVGGAGNDIFRYERGDGSDVLLDEYVNNWELVWQNGAYTNGYVLNAQNATVTKNGQLVFDGSQWQGLYDWTNATQTFRRHLGAADGVIATNAGNDALEFGVGIDIQDLMLRRDGADLQIAITTGDADARAFDAITDRITVRDWYSAGAAIESFVFAATGRHAVSTWSLAGTATEEADSLSGGSGVDWITGNAGDDVILGNAGADILAGNNGADTLRGGMDKDILYGGTDNDVLEGGAGADVLLGDAGLDIASYAGAAATGMRAFLDAPSTNTLEGAGDTYAQIEGIEGTSGNDKLGGDAGENVLRGLGGNDTLYGGTGDDIYEIETAHGQDVILDAPFVTEVIVDAAGVFNSALFTASWTQTGYEPDEFGGIYYYQLVVTRNGTGEEVYRSREGIDFIYYGFPQSTLPDGSGWPFGDGQWRGSAARTGNGFQSAREVFQNGNGGNDTLDFGAGISLSDLSFARLNGGADLQITYAVSNFVTLTGQNDANRAIETLQLNDGLIADLTRLRVVGEAATTGVDFMVGDGNPNVLDGLAGDDVLSGAAGNDTLRGGEGDDVLEGGAGGDTLDGGTDSVSAGLAPPTDPAQPYGDTIRYVRSNTGVTINLETGSAAGGHAAGDTIVRVSGVSTIENVVGSEGFNDTITGDARANRLWGLGGNDTLDGRAGNDVIAGGSGNDTLRGGDGEDNITGDEGTDTLRGGNDNDMLFGGAGVDDLSGDGGNDALSGGADDDVIDGGAGNDRLGGDAGLDQLYGADGDDILAGGEGGDTLYAGDGNDTLSGDAGDDYLSGEDGDDTYAFDPSAGSDLIFDAAGLNRMVVADATPEGIWMTRVGDDLRIAVIGGSADVTIQGYYVEGSSLMSEIALATHSLFLSSAEPLIQAMTEFSQSAPATMPPDIAVLLGNHWFPGGDSAPEVTDQTLTTNEDAPLAGAVGATDPDDDIESYALQAAPARGSLNLNATLGTWVYTPGANLWGVDSFQIVVIDANNNRSVQTVTVNVASVNDAPSGIALSDAPAGIAERDHPPSGTLLEAVVLGTLGATDVDAPDPGDFASHVFTVADARFEVVNGNVLRLRAGAALDFEAAATVSVAVTVTDRNGAPGGLSFTRNFTFDVLDRDDYFYGDNGDDTLTGQAGRNLMYGFGGGDTLTGAGAGDVLDGGDGTDELYGLGGNDVLEGGLGDDILEGGTGEDEVRGGDGFDVLLGQDGGDQLLGEGGGDLLQGGAGADQLDGGGGNDRLEGGAGDDRLVGGESDDVMLGGAGADRFLGGAGSDTVSYEVAVAAVTVNLATGVGTAGEAAGDVFEDTPERLLGSIFADTLIGSANGDAIDGGAGDDLIHGGAGNDTLVGGEGNDTIHAESGDDMLIGGVGSDILVGGDDRDTYRMDLNSGADEIRNFDPNGNDIDVVGYEGIVNRQLWFERSGNDLIVSVIGTSVRTTVKDWYVVASAADRANYKIDFFIAETRVSDFIDAEFLVTLMAGYTKPTTQAQFDALHANPNFEEHWRTAWRDNALPEVPDISSQTINEDGSLTLNLRITDDYTPAAGVFVTVEAVRPDNHAVEDLRLVFAPTLSTSTSAGDRTITVTTKPNASGQVAIKVRATDGGGLVTEKIFLLNIQPTADTPIVTLLPPQTPSAPLTKPTLDSGSWAVNLDASLVDQDGSETLEIRIANVPVGLSFNAGSVYSTNGTVNVWSFTRAQLAGLRIQGPATWAQDLTFSITAISRETETNQTATTTPTTLEIAINARPTDIAADRGLAFNENTGAGTGLAWFVSSDPDAGDSATYTLLNDAGGRFTLGSNGLLSTGNTLLNYEAATSHIIRVRVTDSGGLTREEDFVIAVNNVNEVPTDIWEDRTLVFNEGYGAGTGLAWFGRSDPDAGDGVTWSIVDSAGGRYGVRSDGLLMAGSTPTNYEAATGHWITVRATDSGGLYRDENFWIGVNDVNEGPSLASRSFSIPETAPGAQQYLLGTVAASDPDNNPAYRSLVYRAIGGDSNVFTVSSNGEIRFAGEPAYGGKLWAEQRSSYSVLVEAWDGGAIGAGNSTAAWMNIGVTNVDVTPQVTSVQLYYQWPFPEQYPEYQYYEWYLGVTDPDDATWQGPLQYTIESVYDIAGGITASLYTYLGTTSWRLSNGNSFVQTNPNNIPAWSTNNQELPNLKLRIRVSDPVSGESTVVNVQLITSNGPWQPSAYILPVALDLDGDGIELTAPSDALRFDMNGDGRRDAAGWVSADDALLVLDRDGDGAITQGTEISFAQDLPGAVSDLEGLAAYDTNHDGYLDQGDARFAQFRVWQDANHDGVSQQQELRTLADRGITAINLTRRLTGESIEGATGNVITATTQYVNADGTTGLVGDVSLAYGDTQTTARIIGSDEEVDRRANDNAPAHDPPSALPDVQPLAARVPGPDATAFAGEQQLAATDDDGPAKPRANRDAYAPDLPGTSVDSDDAVIASPQRSGALHTSLELIAKRRLQMIESMAGFGAEGTANLELQPHRSIDPKTLELLTAVPTIRSVA